MKRFALILEAANAVGQKVADGCTRDAERWERWLTSKSGGAWNHDEIKVINNVYPNELTTWFLAVNLAEFAIVTFSGHGYIEEDLAGRRKQMIILGDGSEIDFASLTPNAPKKIMSCDACREVHFREPPVQYSKSASITLNLESRTQAYSRAAYRTAYDQLVDGTRAHTFTMYSCSPDEFAGDDTLDGGYFTDSLLSVAGDWGVQAAITSVLNIDDTFAACALSDDFQSGRTPAPAAPDGRTIH